MAKKEQKKEYARVRADSGHHRRILVVMLRLGIAAFVPVVLQLFNHIGREWHYANIPTRNAQKLSHPLGCWVC